MEELLQQAKKKSDGILQAAGDSILTFDESTLEIDVFNSASERMFGFEPY